ncbi:trace amine-associated receptor 4-like protein [Lates japonicus]|uniref:Trace amine-associated receptor 4-like protein n=1 Tax=Lates japonicus TaxID=270547 RepID=A0AAD3N9M1_LATJO|nr:trace amine-associated receptor 4-like protein [Lates japonicus]
MMEEDELCFPQLLNTSCKKPKPPPSETVFIHILLFFISVLTAALNLLVIISISHYSSGSSSPTNLILLSLAVSDFFVGLLLIPAETLQTGFCWVLGDHMCALYFFLPFILITASVVNMVLISVDRYVAICDPMHYSTRITDKIINVSVCLCWIFSVIYSIFLLFDHLKQPGNILVGSSAEAFMSFLMYFNSCLNPVISFFYPGLEKL